MCWLLVAPPTALLSAGQRNPDVTMMGAPHASRRGSRMFSPRAVRLALTAALGELSIPSRLAVAERVSSVMVKYFIIVPLNIKACHQIL